MLALLTLFTIIIAKFSSQCQQYKYTQIRHIEIQMVNLTAAIRNMAQIMLFKGTQFAKNHKKKLIFALVLVLLIYIAKKKLTLSHVIKFAETFSKVLELIPLPQAPKLRKTAQYCHSQSVPLKAIYECMNVKSFQKRIEARENCFEELKVQHLTGTVLTLVLYNANAFYFLVQNKYSEDFLELNASTQFQQIMYDIRKRFVHEISILFNKLKQLLNEQINRVQLKQTYNIQELNQLFENMVDKVLSAKFDRNNEQVHTSINKVSKQTKNRFFSQYEFIAEKTKSKLTKVGSSVFRAFGQIISYSDWFPSPKIEITNDRLDFVKYAFVLPLKKARSQAEIKLEESTGWPNQQSRQLFCLVMEELQFGLQSLNFSILLKAYAKYNLKILRNRIKKLMIVKNKQEISMLVLLAALHKILNEEFFKSNQLQLRDNYHNSQVRKALKLMTKEAPAEQQAQPQNLVEIVQPISEEQHVLEQVYLKNSFQYLEKEYELKLFNERSGVVLRPKKDQAREADEMQKLLSMMGASEPLNQQD